MYKGKKKKWLSRDVYRDAYAHTMTLTWKKG